MFNRIVNFKYRATKDILLLSLPIIIAQISHITVNLVDIYFAGKIDTQAIAICALSGGIFSIPLFFCFGFSNGLTPMVAIINNPQAKESKNLLSQSLKLNIAISLVIFLLLLSIVLFPFFDSYTFMHSQGIIYYIILCSSIIPLMIFNTFKQYLEGLGFTKKAMQIALIGNVINIILGYVLTFGVWKFSGMGILGIAISTLLSRVYFAGGIIFYFFYSKKIKSFAKNIFWKKIDWNKMKIISKLSFPIAGQCVVEVSTFAIANLLMGLLGPASIAAHQIVLNIASIPFLIYLSLGAGIAIRTAQAYGKNNFQSYLENIKAGAVLTYGLVIVAVCIIFFFNQDVLRLFSQDKQVILIATQLFFWVMIFQIFDATQAVGLNILRSIKDVKLPFYATIIAYWIIGIPASIFFLEYLNQAQGVWIGLTIGLFVISVKVGIRLYVMSLKKFKLKRQKF